MFRVTHYVRVTLLTIWDEHGLSSSCKVTVGHVGASFVSEIRSWETSVESRICESVTRRSRKQSPTDGKFEVAPRIKIDC